MKQEQIEQIRIAVAEELGWKFETYEDGDGQYTVPVGTTKSRLEYTASWDEVPNYPADLNACAEFEATLENPDRYLELLDKEIGGEHPAFAPPLQRCIAFLKTRNKNFSKPQ